MKHTGLNLLFAHHIAGGYVAHSIVRRTIYSEIRNMMYYHHLTPMRTIIYIVITTVLVGVAYHFFFGKGKRR